MDISVERTLPPLQVGLGEHISNVIKNLRPSGRTVLETPLIIHGEFDQVMPVLNAEIKNSFDLMDRGLLYVKIIKSDRSDYEPHF